MSTPPPGAGATPWWKNSYFIVGAFVAPLVVAVLVALFTSWLDGDDKERDEPAEPFAACARALKAADSDAADLGDAGEPRYFSVPPDPVDLVAKGASVFVAHEDGRVSRIAAADPSSPDVLSGKVGSGPYGQVAIAEGSSALFVVRARGRSDEGAIAKVHPRGGTLAHDDLGKPDDVAVGGGWVWVTTDEFRLLKIDPQDLSVSDSFTIGADPHGLAIQGPCMYVATSRDHDGFIAYEAANGKEIGRYPDAAVAPKGGVGEVAVGEGMLWLRGSRLAPFILAVDPDAPDAQPRVLDELPRRAADDALAIGFGSAWTAAQGADVVYRIDLDSGDRQEIPLQGRPVSIAITTDPDYVWVALRDRDEVVRLEP